MAGMTRGSLPAEIYWRRRLVVLTVLGLIAIMVLQVTGGEDAAPVNDSRAAVVNAEVSATPAYAVVSGSVIYPKAGNIDDVEVELPESEGTCSEADIRLSASTLRSRAGKDVWWQVMMSTAESAACTFTIKPTAMQMRVTQGANVIWSTLDCPGALARRQVVIGRSVQTPVTFRWTGKRSSSRGCTSHGNWVKPGRYKLTVSVLGGRVTTARFDLT